VVLRGVVRYLLDPLQALGYLSVLDKVLIHLLHWHGRPYRKKVLCNFNIFVFNSLLLHLPQSGV